MRFTGYSFGSIRVDGMTYDHDLIIEGPRRPASPPGRVAVADLGDR
jgi:hypothetical protein